MVSRECVRLLSLLGMGVANAVPPKTEPDFEVADLAIEPLALDDDDVGASPPRRYRLSAAAGHREWTLETKVVLGEADLRRLAHLVARLAPVGSTARLQADGHGAGNVFVGLVLAYETGSVPVQLVSGDIGCGLALVPLVDARGRHVARASHAEGDALEYHSYVLASIRRALKRGKVADQGLSESRYLAEACRFYGAELTPWLWSMAFVLRAVGLIDARCAADEMAVLAFIGRYTQSLGSSGNHFMELAADDDGLYWLVVHSGSRALGAKVYGVVAEACRATTPGGWEVATGPLAHFYARAYDALNLFAKLNRVICAVAVLDDLGLETSAPALRSAMAATRLFAPTTTDGNALLGGLTHNGLKAFVNDETRQVMHVLSKGAVAVSRRESAVIVALRAGEGCVVFTLVDPSCPWRESALADVPADYQAVFDAGDGVVFAGHGAGRAQSTSETARQSTFSELAGLFAREGIAGNLAPGVLGDNPGRAYKPSAEILPHLPLDGAATRSMMRTCASHKEGLSFRKADVAACAQYVQGAYKAHPLAPLWCDFNLVRGHLPDADYEEGVAMRDALLAALSLKYKKLLV